MAIRKRPDGTYVIRYYADGTKRSAQRQETLRGISYAEAVRIYKKKLAKAAARRGNAGASDRLSIEAAEKSNRLCDGCATEEKATTGNVAKSLDENWWPQRDSNPCRGLERAVS
jgi:hypothetical protein